MEFQITWAQPDDRPSIDVVTKAFEHKGYSHNDEFFDQSIAARQILIASSNNKPAGYLILQVLWGNTPFLALIRVLSEFQGKGLGSQLLAKLEDHLRQLGYESLISSTEEINKESQIFHDKRGFEPIGDLQMIYGKEKFYKKDL